MTSLFFDTDVSDLFNPLLFPLGIYVAVRMVKDYCGFPLFHVSYCFAMDSEQHFMPNCVTVLCYNQKTSLYIQYFMCVL